MCIRDRSYIMFPWCPTNSLLNSVCIFRSFSVDTTNMWKRTRVFFLHSIVFVVVFTVSFLFNLLLTFRLLLWRLVRGVCLSFVARVYVVLGWGRWRYLIASLRFKYSMYTYIQYDACCPICCKLYCFSLSAQLFTLVLCYRNCRNCRINILLIAKSMTPTAQALS